MKLSSAHATLFCLLSLALAAPALGAPKHGSRRFGQGAIRYDQKQTGGYNVQVRVKDFHIIAMLGDDFVGGHGDYDYNYDYSDLTIKPSLTATTAGPQGSNVSSSDSSSTDPEKPTELPLGTSGTEITTELTPNQPENASTTPTVETPKPAEESNEESPITNVSIVPLDNLEITQSDQQLRKCSEGFVKDKQGRCKKVVRKAPQLQLGIARLASSLAQKIHQAATSEDTSP